MISVIWRPPRHARQLGMAHGWFSWTRHSCRQRLLFRTEKRAKRPRNEHKPISQVSHP
jgi:hypothetical protein